MSAKRALLIVLALALLGLVVLGVVAAVFVPRYVEREALAAARERGFELTPGEISFGWGWVQVSKGKLRLVGVKSVTATFELADVSLAGTRPEAFALQDVGVEATGNPLVVAQELQGWARVYEKRTTEPVSISRLSLALRTERGQNPELLLTGGKLTLQAGRLAFTAERSTVRGQALGALRLNRQGPKAQLASTLNLSPLDNPLLTLELTDGERTQLHAVLAPVPVGKLNQAFGLKLPRPDVTVSGTSDLELPKSLLAEQPKGRVDFKLKGYVPPHPIELDGFVFGDTTEVGATLALELARLRIAISDARVKAGRFELTGGGELRLEGAHGRLTLALRGELPCSALAGAVAETRLGQALGKVTGKAARTVVGGGVGVRVSVDLTTDDPDSARVLKTITPGCGLRPLSFEDLVRLGELAPEALDPRVRKDLERLLHEGLTAPPGTALPDLKIPGLNQLNLPALPGFGFQLGTGTKSPGTGGATGRNLTTPERGGAGGAPAPR